MNDTIKNPDLSRKVKELTAYKLGVELDQVTDEATIGPDLGADSLDGIDLIMVMEEEFGVEISDAEAELLSMKATVQQLVELIDQKIDHPVR